MLDFGDLQAKVLLEPENMRIVVRHQPEVFERLEATLERFEQLKANGFPLVLSTLAHKVSVFFWTRLRCHVGVSMCDTVHSVFIESLHGGNAQVLQGLILTSFWAGTARPQYDIN